MNQQELDKLIASYFDGETSTEEECVLRRMLANPEATSTTADEARAVMGVFAAQRISAHSAGANRDRLSPWRVAAGIAILLAAGVAALAVPGENEEDICIAYYNGSETHNSSEVLAIMDADLSAMACAAGSIDTSIEDDFDALINAINTSNQ